MQADLGMPIAPALHLHITKRKLTLLISINHRTQAPVVACILRLALRMVMVGDGFLVDWKASKRGKGNPLGFFSRPVVVAVPPQRTHMHATDDGMEGGADGVGHEIP